MLLTPLADLGLRQLIYACIDTFAQVLVGLVRSILRAFGFHRQAIMNRDAIEVGAFTWARIERLYDADSVAHWQRCEAEGLQCPQEVFTQLFSEEANNEDFAVIVRAVDWGRVTWELQEMSGVALRHVRVDRAFQLALDEARDRAT
jgi:hypothetical protein